MTSRFLYRLFLPTLLIIPAVGVIPTMASFWVSISWGDKIALETVVHNRSVNTGTADSYFNQADGVADVVGKEQDVDKRSSMIRTERVSGSLALE